MLQVFWDGDLILRNHKLCLHTINLFQTPAPMGVAQVRICSSHAPGRRSSLEGQVSKDRGPPQFTERLNLGMFFWSKRVAKFISFRMNHGHVLKDI